MIKRQPLKTSYAKKRIPLKSRFGLKPSLKVASRLTPKKPKKGKSAKLRELKEAWYIPTTNNFKLRYTGLRGVYWYWLYRQVRKDEWEKWEGKCLTCLVPLATWEEGQCGHVVPSAGCGEFLRLNKINLTIQHAKCNNPRFHPEAPARNAIHYDKRYGQGAWEKLYAMRKTEAREPKQEEYRQLICALPSYQTAKKELELKLLSV